MDTYGGPHSPREGQTGIGDSLGRMGAAYIDDLNYGLEDYGEAAKNIGSDRIIGSGGHGIDPVQAVGFMRELGRDEDAHSIMSAAEEGFTASRVHHFAGTDDAYRAAEIGAKGHGALDEARAEQIGADYREDAAKRNEKLEEAAGWKKQIASVAVYATAGAVATTVPEGSVLIPTILGGGGSGTNSSISAAIDDALAAHTYDNSGKSIHSLEQFDQRSQANATQTIRDHMERSDVSESQFADRLLGLERSYESGQRLTDTDNSR